MNYKTARVIAEHKTQYVIKDADKEYTAVIRGKILLNGKKDFPKVGDYVEYSELSEGQAVVESILPRTSHIVRKTALGNEPQTIVTNVDIMFIVMGLDADFNVRRLERYLALAEQSAVKPVIVLNKTDVVPDARIFIEEVEALAKGVPVHAISASTGANIDVLKTHITPTTTAVLLGSSGAGKSTIMNWFLGQHTQATQAVREGDAKGRHTTTSRELFALPDGGYLIDTPGMRNLGLFSSDNAEENVFSDIEELLTHCIYPDCDHEKSRGCAIRHAIYDGKLDAKHFANYCKLKQEREQLEGKLSTSVRKTSYKRNRKDLQDDEDYFNR